MAAPVELDHLSVGRPLQQPHRGDAAVVVGQAAVGLRLRPRPDTHLGRRSVQHVLELVLGLVQQPRAALAMGAQVAPARGRETGDHVGCPVALLVGEHRAAQQGQLVIADRAGIGEDVGMLVEVCGRCVSGPEVGLDHDRHQRVGVGA